MNTLSIIFLIFLLLIAVISDIRSYRIPNKLILLGIVIGIISSVVFVGEASTIDLTDAVLGFCIGLIIFLPFHIFCAMGAGDVKLIAMIGTFVGPVAILQISFYTVIAGGILAISVLIWNGRLTELINFLKILLLKFQLTAIAGNSITIPIDQALPRSNSKLPYGVAIAAGTMFYLVASF